MKVVIFAGGFGTRLSEETRLLPKPMVEINGRPILWHIMKIYSHYGFNEFVICCGYKGEMIKEYFANYFLRYSDVSFDFRDGKNSFSTHKQPHEKWKVTLVDTGLKTQTAGRLAKVKEYIDTDNFFLTYGDGVSDVNIEALLNFHQKNDKIATVTAVQPLGRFGALDINNNIVENFVEKPVGEGGWINGGFFVLNKKVFDYLPENSNDIMWEQEPMKNLAKNRELVAYHHEGFWQPMDTLREKHVLEKMAQDNKAPWVTWND